MSGASEARLAVGTRLERYEIVRFIANGGFGDVYEARDTRLGRRVVVKSLRAEVAAVADTRARFLREGRLAAAIEHNNVVRVFDVLEEADGVAYLVMEYLDGCDLGEQLAARGPLPVEWLCDLMLPVCAAVAQVHANGILHRDIKPGNIFLSRSSDDEVIPKLLDFGISRPLDDQTGDLRTRTGTVLGSPRYMSPEQFDGQRKPDGRADVYALGAVLYRCSTGALPYQHRGDEHSVELFTIISRIAARQLAPPRSWRSDLSAEFEAVVLRAMAYERENRYGDARELGCALLPFASVGARARWEQVLTRPGRPSHANVKTPSPLPNEGAATMHLDITTTSASVSSVSVAPASVSPARRSLRPWIAMALAIVLCSTCAGIAVRSQRASHGGSRDAPHGDPLVPPVPPLAAPPPSTTVPSPSPTQAAASVGAPTPTSGVGEAQNAPLAAPADPRPTASTGARTLRRRPHRVGRESHNTTALAPSPNAEPTPAPRATSNDHPSTPMRGANNADLGL